MLCGSSSRLHWMTSMKFQSATIHVLPPAWPAIHRIEISVGHNPWLTARTTFLIPVSHNHELCYIMLPVSLPRLSIQQLHVFLPMLSTIMISSDSRVGISSFSGIAIVGQTGATPNSKTVILDVELFLGAEKHWTLLGSLRFFNGKDIQFADYPNGLLCMIRASVMFFSFSVSHPMI
jgi:hypothetical protein